MVDAHAIGVRVLSLTRPLNLGRTLSPLQRGPYDPCTWMRHDEVLRATRTPDGPATLHLVCPTSSSQVDAQAWGLGGTWALEHLPDLVGDHDDGLGFEELIQSKPSSDRSASLVWDLYRKYTGLRIPKTRAVTEALVPTILEQKVTGVEAYRSYRRLVRALGDPAPGPTELVNGLMVPPSPVVLASAPSWVFHRGGVEEQRAGVIRLACSYAARLEKLVDITPDEARARLMTLPGIGEWSAAEVSLVALGDADAVSVGDFHLPSLVSWVFTGNRRGDDDTMLHLLEPFRGHRGRVQRLLELSGLGPPRRAPRRNIRTLREWRSS